MKSRDDLLRHALVQPGACGASNLQPLLQISKSQRGDIFARKHACPPSRQYHQARNRVLQQFTPRHGEKIVANIHCAARVP